MKCNKNPDLRKKRNDADKEHCLFDGIFVKKHSNGHIRDKNGGESCKVKKVVLKIGKVVWFLSEGNLESQRHI